MRTIDLTRITVGIEIVVGLLYFRPLIWFVAFTHIIAGFTGVCFLDRLYRALLGKDFGKKKAHGKSAAGEVSKVGGAYIP